LGRELAPVNFMRPSAASVRGLKLLVLEALSYLEEVGEGTGIHKFHHHPQRTFKHEAFLQCSQSGTQTCALKLLVYAPLSY
jgi:hypothetical protein